MSPRIALASITFVGLLVSSNAVHAQSASSSSSSPPMADPNTIYLAPLTPQGTAYGAPASSAPPASAAPSSPSPDATTVVPPTAPVPAWAAGASGSPSSPAPIQITASAAPPPLAPVSSASAFAPPLPSPRARLLRERLRLLDTSLPPMAESSRRSRIMNGVIQMASGTIMGAVGFILPPGGGTADLRPVYWTLGGLAIATGILDLAWTPARERLTAQYMALPFATAHERRLRARFGERALESMAADGQRRRILGSVVGALVPVVMLAIAYRGPIFNGSPYSVGPYDYVLIGISAVEAISSLVGLFTRSEEERLRDMYRQQIQMREAVINSGSMQ